MKKFILFAVLAFLFAGCGEKKEKDAVSETQETEVQNVIVQYFNALARQDWDDMKEFSTDDLIVFEDGKIWNNDSIIIYMEKYWTGIDINYSFEFIETSIGHDFASIVYKSHAHAVLSGEDINVYWLESALLKKNGGDWKLAVLHSSEEYMPEYEYNPEDKFNIKELTNPYKHGRSVYLMCGNISAGISHAKKCGVSVESYAKYVGDLFKETWDPDSGFDQFVSSSLVNYETFRTKRYDPMTIVEQSDTKVVLKLQDPFETFFEVEQMFDITHEEYCLWFEIVMQTIADHLDSEFTQEKQEDGWILLTFEKK